jgi:hypothetical protein
MALRDPRRLLDQLDAGRFGAAKARRRGSNRLIVADESPEESIEGRASLLTGLVHLQSKEIPERWPGDGSRVARCSIWPGPQSDPLQPFLSFPSKSTTPSFTLLQRLV